VLNLFGSREMARGYAESRPNLHPLILERLRPHLPCDIGIALDVGCGAGLSTRALQPLANVVFGIEPIEAMLRLAPEIAPGAQWIAGSAEAFPIASRRVDLITAAGSLNYVNLERFFPEASRSLRPNGTLVVYDFSAGRRLASGPGLEAWFDGFMSQYPAPQDHSRPLSPQILASMQAVFGVAQQECFEVTLPMSLDAYVNYMLTETNVASAVRSGAPMAEIRDWCERSLRDLWPEGAQQVVFECYYALLVPMI
jgi:SAM-dependent methyltransferase